MLHSHQVSFSKNMLRYLCMHFQTEESLSELQVNINPAVSKKVLSVLKDTFTDDAGIEPHPEVDQTKVPESEGEL